MRTVGLALGCWAGLFLLAVLVGCDAAGPTRPDPVAEAPAPVAAAPAPTPTPSAAPGVIADPPAGFELACLPDSTLTVTYTGGASHAGIETFYTTFDDQETAFGLQKHSVTPGATVTRAFGQVCIQGDADQPGVKLIGGCFYDINGKPFVPSRSPEKVKECRDRCVEEWLEIENDPEISYGEWSECKPETSPSEANGENCSKKRTVTITYTEQNTCTKARRKGRTVVREESSPCECPCVEPREVREVPSTFSWAPEILQGQCQNEVGPIVIDTFTTPALNCRQIGTQKIILDYVCSADGETTRNLCRNVACPTPPPTCELPEEGSVKSWEGKGDPQTECEAFGDYDAIEQGTPDFYICKAGNDREVDYQEPGATCGNGKERSHTTRCVCAKDE